MNKYTSLKFSKFLADNGFEEECDNSQDSFGNLYDNGLKKKVKVIRELDLLPAYDILNDLCVRYRKELFGDALDIMTEKNFLETYTNKTYAKDLYKRIIKTPMYVIHSEQIIRLLQQNKKDEAESYIRKYCVLNPKNKR